MPSKKIVLAACCLLAGAVQAQQAAPAPAGEATVIGAATDALLSLQGSQMAAGHPHPVQGEVAQRAYQRYLDGFSQPAADHGKEKSATSARPLTR